MTHPYLDSAVKKDLKINQGSLYKWEFTWKDANDDIVALAGKTARLCIGSDYSTHVEEYTAEITLADTAPNFSLTLDATDTAALNAGDYVYDLEIDFGSNDVVRLYEGSLTVSPQVPSV